MGPSPTAQFGVCCECFPPTAKKTDSTTTKVCCECFPPTAKATDSQPQSKAVELATDAGAAQRVRAKVWAALQPGGSLLQRPRADVAALFAGLRLGGSIGVGLGMTRTSIRCVHAFFFFFLGGGTAAVGCLALLIAFLPIPPPHLRHFLLLLHPSLFPCQQGSLSQLDAGQPAKDHLHASAGHETGAGRR